MDKADWGWGRPKKILIKIKITPTTLLISQNLVKSLKFYFTWRSYKPVYDLTIVNKQQGKVLYPALTGSDNTDNLYNMIHELSTGYVWVGAMLGSIISNGVKQWRN